MESNVRGPTVSETGEAEAHGRKTAEGLLVCIDSITFDPISGELRASLLRWQVLDICLCDTAGIATDRPLVYGKRQGIIQPASASNIPGPRADPAQRCSARCVEDDPSRRTPERSSDDYHPPDRSPQ